MQAVSNQLSYKELEPLPIPVEKWTALIKLISRVVFIVAITGFCAVFGGSIGLAELGFSVMTGAVGGGVVGLVASVVLSYFTPFPSKIAQYRLDTLNNVYGQLAKDKKVEDKFKGLRNFLTYPLEQFRQTFQNHELHNALTFVADRITDYKRPDLKKVWKVFLEHLNHTKVLYPDGQTVELDFTTELERLEGKHIIPEMDVLDPESATYDQDLQQLEELQRVCFGRIGTFVKDQLKQELAQPDSGCVLARREGSQEIIGFGWYSKKEGIVNINGLGHAPGAARLSIGDRLLTSIIRLQPQGQPIQLLVRVSNPARNLYANWGFVEKEKIPNYVDEPTEDALLMELDWTQFEKAWANVPKPNQS